MFKLYDGKEEFLGDDHYKYVIKMKEEVIKWILKGDISIIENRD